MNAPPAGPRPVRAVFFDVDFTLIYPGPTLQGDGYQQFCAAHGLRVDPARFHEGVVAASPILHDAEELRYNADVFIKFTRRIIEVMAGAEDRAKPAAGGSPERERRVEAAMDAAAADIYREWAACQHFFLYDDVTPVLRELDTRGFKVGLISNSHRCLASFQQHFELHGLIAGAISSSDHGFLKPHPSIFEAALRLMGVTAEESVMVGDSLAHDIEGARRVGMRAVLVRRADPGVGDAAAEVPGVPVIRSLVELPKLLS